MEFHVGDKILRVETVVLAYLMLAFGQLAFAVEKPSSKPASNISSGNSSPSSTSSATSSSGIVEGTPTPDPSKIIPQPTPRTPTERERQTSCKKHEGKYISYFGDVYKVDGCKRRRILSHIAVSTLARQHISIVAVDSEPIANLPEGEPMSDTTHNVTRRTCKELNSRYVTYSYNDIFFVEKCKKRLFPDWATYLTHRSRFSAQQREIQGLTWLEFEGLQMGEDFTSSMDIEYAKAREADKPMAIIPVKEACKGIDGRVVSFHSRMYRIENCHKRELDPEKFTQKRQNQGTRIVELTPEQWYSLPDGKDLK